MARRRSYGIHQTHPITEDPVSTEEAKPLDLETIESRLEPMRLLSEAVSPEAGAMVKYALEYSDALIAEVRRLRAPSPSVGVDLEKPMAILEKLDARLLELYEACPEDVPMEAELIWCRNRIISAKKHLRATLGTPPSQGATAPASKKDRALALGYTMYHYDKDVESRCYFMLVDPDGDYSDKERKTEAEAWEDFEDPTAQAAPSQGATDYKALYQQQAEMVSGLVSRNIELESELLAMKQAQAASGVRGAMEAERAAWQTQLERFPASSRMTSTAAHYYSGLVKGLEKAIAILGPPESPANQQERK